jgi:drug/metabolite transporter superfamily protein YnfA
MIKSSTTAVLLILLIVFSFPIWIGIIGGLFGIIAGIFGAVFGVIGAIAGGIFHIFAGLFGWAFEWHWPFHINWNGYTILVIAIIIVLLSRSRKI